MARTRQTRRLPDPIAIASQGRATSQVSAQESSEKPVIISTLEEI